MAERRPYLSRLGELDFSQFRRAAPRQPAFYSAPQDEIVGALGDAGQLINQGSKIRRAGGYMASTGDLDLPPVYQRDPQLDALEAAALAGAGEQVYANINNPPQNPGQRVKANP